MLFVNFFCRSFFHVLNKVCVPNIQLAFLQEPSTYPSQSLVYYPQSLFAPQSTARSVLTKTFTIF